jgi:hypothetical protein
VQTTIVIMKNLIIALMLTSPFLGNAQAWPRASQKAEVEQVIGLTEVEVEYHRPNVRGRKIFGDVVPLGEIWRTGANQATTIEFSLPVKFGGVAVDSGKYAIFTIPSEKEWVVILNKNYGQWGSDAYEEKDNVAKITVPAQKMERTVETMSISFDEVLANKANLVLKWEQTKIVVAIETEMEKHMENLIKTMLDDPKNKPGQVYTNAARYYLQDENISKAENYIKQALKADDTNWLAWWVQAQILQEQGKTKEAIKSGDRAIELGDKASDGKGFAYKERLQEVMKDWSKKK